jgi:hypothetical protein
VFKPDPKPWLKPAVYYAKRYIPGYTRSITLQDRASGKNVVEFNTYDVANDNRKRSIYSALPKITNMFLYESGYGNALTSLDVSDLLPLSACQIEVWGYNFAELPIARPHLNTLLVYVSGSTGVFASDDYIEVERYSTIAMLSASNPTFRGIPVNYELIPVIDKTKSTTSTIPKTVYYTRKNKLKLTLPNINRGDGCIDIIVASAAGYTTLQTLTNDYICS